MQFLHRQLMRIGYALQGLTYGIRYDSGVQINLVIGVVLIIFGYLLWPLSHVELLFLGLGFSILFITELQNSALEHALDRVHPEFHEEIKQSKDMAAASVLVAAIFIGIVILSILFPRIF